MNLSVLDFSRLRGPRAHPRRQAVPTEGASGGTPAGQNGVQAAPPAFTFTSPPPARRTAREWLESVIETPRLLEPAVRRQARAVLDADPLACREKALALLTASSPKVRLAGADLVASHAPRRAEAALLALVEDERAPAEVQVEAMQLLAQQGGDRHEMLWVQRLLRDGAVAAGHALATLLDLSEKTRTALQSVLEVPARTERDSAARLRTDLLAAQAACILGAHGALEPEAVRRYLEALPENHRDHIIASVLDGVPAPWAVELLIKTTLRGHGYPALQALLDCDPALVRAALAPYQDGADSATRTRLLVLQWLILGEGDEAQIRQLADAGETLASGALNLARTHRCDLAQMPPDALLAAAQILSLRLGYAFTPQEQISAAFHGAATGQADRALFAQMPELEPFAQVYTRPEVYDAVQVALHAEDGLSALLAALARRPENRSYQQELAFWSDKTTGQTRLLLTHALSAARESSAAHTALAARAADPCPIVRAAALRALHARPYSPETPEQRADSLTEALPAGPEEPLPPAPSINQAA